MRKIYFLLLTVLLAAVTNAQVANYTFSQSNGAYTPITGGTVIVTATDPLPAGLDSACMDDFTYAEYALPFPFFMPAGMQTTFRVNSNGWLGFGTGNTTNSTGPIGSTLPFNGITSPFSSDLLGLSHTTGTITSGSNTITAVTSTTQTVIGAFITGTGIPAGTTITGFTVTTITMSANATATTAATFVSWTTGEIRFNTLGVAPNRTFVVQFSGISQYSTGTTSAGLGSQINFQIRLSEGGGSPANQTISIVYGNSVHPGTSTTGQVGLRGATNADFNNRTTTTDWSATTAGATNTASVTWGAAIVPASGLTFTWTPPPACVTPGSQPTALVLTPTAGAVNGSFTAAAGAPTGYLVIRTTSAAAPTNPVDGTTYTPGSSALGGLIIASGAPTTFTSGGLSPSTTYYYWVYSFNNTVCTGGPVYLTASPLTQSATTLACTVTGNKTVGPTGNYATLTAALADITTNGLAGPVILELQPAYTSGGETFPITIGALPCPVNGLTIRPQTGAVGLLITSANATATIDLNGATNVTIDGRPGGLGTTSQLTVSNTATGTAADIRFINDASNNTITYTTLLGSSSTTNGVVLFSTGSVIGNDANMISNNTISAAGANNPLNGVVSLGTSAAINNSGNTVTDNNIADIFSATSIYNGVSLGTGNSGWTINNNRIYQTATRTVTTSNTVNGINITSGNGHTISGNVIGFASATATGIMTLNSTVALRYIGINGSFTVGGSVNSIQGNTIAGIAMTTSSGATTTNGILAGINITSGEVNIGTVTGNTIGATTGTGSLAATATTSGGLLVGINSSSTGNVSIQNNTLGSLTSSGITATIAGSVTGINVSGVAASMTINGNTIGNNTANNIRGGTAAFTTGSSLVSGINLPSTPGAVTITNNTIQNLSSYGTGTTGFVRGIWTAAVAGSGTVFNITGNSINNLTTDATLTTIANGQGAVTGINLGAGFNSIISQNVIHTLSNINTTATGNFAGGIIHANATNTLISRNRIYNIINAGTSTTVTTPSIAAGIINRSGTNFTTIANNMISLGNSQTTNTSFLGIMLNHGSTPDPINNIYFNSINIEGTATAGAQPSFGIARTDFSATAKTAPVDIRNNIVTNNRSGGTGFHFAIANNYGAAAASVVGWGMNASNFNVLNANAATVGWWTSNQTFAGWKTASNGDANSFSGITVNYINTAIGDLHLNMGVTPTPLESGGTTGTGITNDYDNQTRPGPTGSVNGGALAPDLGADEFDGVIQDVSGPSITYALLANTLCNASRTLSVTITDISGINTAAGTRPRVYFKKTTNANVLPGTNTNTTDGWKWVEASNTTNPFTFTIDPSLIFGGVAAGDIIQYFVVAQDLAATPNVSINNGTFTGTPTSVALAAGNFPITGTINSYTVGTGGLTGTVTIGAAGTYTSLTGAGGLFAAINSSGLTGNLTANILDASVTETGTNALNQMLYGCAGPFTLTIKPGAGVTSTLTGTLASNALIRILSSNVIVDGSNNGTTSRDLTITNTNTTAPLVLLFGSTGTVPVINSTLKNSIIINGANTATAVMVSDAAAGVAGYFNNITIQNNSIQRAFIGNYNIAVPVTGNGSGLLVTGNDLTTSGANSIRLVGIYVQGVDGSNITNNTIGNFANTLDASNLTGIWYATSSINGTISGNTITTISGTSASPRGIAISSSLPGANINVRNNTITGLSSPSTGTTTGIFIFSTTSGVNVEKNQIRDIKNSNSTGFGANGIQLSSTLVAANVNVNNNFISDVAASGFNGSGVGDNGYGIILTSGGGYNIDFNTVNLNTNQLTGVGLPSAININAAVNTPGSVNIRNNIFANTQTTGTNRYAIFSAAPNTVFGTIDYNDYYTTGPNLGFIDGVARSNLAAIQAGFGGNLNSINVLPVFVSTTDLHLSNAPGANICLNGSGIPIAGITTDIDNQIRSVGVPPNGPDMGADEFNAVNDVVITPASQTICSGSSITTIIFSGSATSYNWTRNNTGTVTGIAGSGSGNISGTLTNTTNAPLTVTFTITPVFAGGCNGPAMTATVLVNPMPNAVATPSSQTVCSGTPITTVALTGNVAGTVYNWTRDNTVSVTGIAASGSGNISGTLTNTTNAPVTVTFTITPTANGCPGTPVTSTVLVNPTPNAVATPSSQTICSGSAITTIALTGNVGSTVFNWTRDNGTVVGGPVSGIAAAGSGDISGSLTNTTNSPVTVTFTITPTANGCAGSPITSTVLVNPTPNAVATPSSQTICSGSPITTIALTGNVSGTVFNWTRDNGTVVGGPVSGIAAAGSGDISGSLTNTTTSAVTVTFTITPSANGCSGTPVTASVTVNPQPVISSTVVQPTTCVSPDGSITLTITGASGPFNFAWTGAGVIPGSQNQTGLIAGIYSVIVTDIPGGCSASAIFNLVGPGGCAICPTIGSVSTNPSGATCQNQATSVTASGLVGMGITYGIQFIYSPTALANPYAGGTVIATVPNGSLTGGGTGATTNTSFATPGSYFVYAILTPTPLDPGCRPSAVVNLQVNPTPNTVATPSSQTTCSGAAITTIALTGAVSGTVFNWTRDQTVNVTGIAASGSGDITGALTNSTNAPITVTFTITPTANGCAGSSTTATVTVNPTPNAVATPSSQTICSGASITTIALTGAVAGTTYNWTRDNTASVTGIAASGSGNISGALTNTTNAPVTVTFTVTPTANSCPGSSVTATVTVNPTPNTVATPASQTTCSGAAITTIALTGAVSGTTFNWTRDQTLNVTGIAASGAGNISGSLTNTTSAAITVTFTITPTANGCAGPTSTATVVVNPTPTVNAVTNQTLCNGSSTTAVSFSGAVTGTVFNWTNNTISIGLAASGTGNIASFVATNATTAPVTATVTVTPSYTNAGTTCTGTPTTFTITVNPTPTVTAVANQILCNGSSTTAVNFSGGVAGTVFNWTNNTTSIGLGASGTGNIASFVATNASATPVIATITVTPSYTNGSVTCTGTPTTFTITVNPIPTVNAIANQTVCATSSTAAVTFSGPVAGTVFTWTNNNTSIGLAANGTGNIASFVAVNAGTVPVTANITVSPIGPGCVGAPVTFTITVNPRPTATAVTSQVICAGSSSTAVTFAGAVPNTVFSWTNNTTSIGLAASGIGNIPAFVTVNAGTTAVVATITVTPSFTADAVTCTGTPITFTYTVNPRPVVTATPLVNRICLSDTVIALTGTPVGGSWSGIGVSGTNFVPGATAVGTYTLTYSYASTLGCIGTSVITAKVEACPERVRLLEDDALILYPNPNNGRFNVRINSTLYNYIGMKVYDVNGRLVNGTINNSVLTSPVYGGLVFGRVIPIDLSRLPAGVYFVKFYYGDGGKSAEKAFKVVIAAH